MINDDDEKYRLEQERKARYAKDWRERHPGYMAAKSKMWWHSHPENTARYAAKKRLQRQQRMKAKMENG